MSDIPTKIQLTPFVARTADIQVQAAAPGLRLMGYAVRESAGTPAVATAILRHGTADTDPLIVPIELAANESDHEWMWPGILVEDGIFLEVAGGEVDISVYHVVGI